MKASCHLFITGYVQGVFFRAGTREVANSLSLSGWVRNLRDGRVEVQAEGEMEDLQRLIEWSKKGPRGARVSDVKVEYGDFTGAFDGFKIRYD